VICLLVLFVHAAGPSISQSQESLAPRVEDGQVIFYCQAPAAGAVYLAGSFNGWNAQADPMERDEDGIWRLAMTLPAGRHEYKFVIDGNWTTDPNAHDTGPDGYGGQNAVLTLAGAGENLTIVAPEKGAPTTGAVAAVSKSVLPYVSGRYVSSLITRRDKEDDNRFGLTRPQHDIRLDFSVDVSSEVSAWAETRINTLDDDPTLRLHRAHIVVDLKYYRLLPYHNELLVEFDDPMHLVGHIGDLKDPFGEQTQGIVLTSSAISAHTLGMARIVRDAGTELLGFYADDEKEVDRTGLRFKVGESPSVGISFLRIKPVQAVPVLTERTISQGVNQGNWTFLPATWWRQFYPQYYDSTGQDTRSFDVEHYFHFTKFEIGREADKTYAADIRLPLFSEDLILFGEVALRRYPTMEAVSDVHTYKTSSGSVEYDSTTVIFNEKYDTDRFLGGLIIRPNEALELEFGYELENQKATTNLGRSTDFPVTYEPQITLFSGRARLQVPSMSLLLDPELAVTFMLEKQKLLDGFVYGEHWAFYEYPRYDRYGYVNNFQDLYLRDVKQTLTLQSNLSFSTAADWHCRIDAKHRRYTMEQVGVQGGELVKEDVFLKTWEVITQAEVPIVDHIWAGANLRVQTYEYGSDELMYWHVYYGNPYLELSYRPSQNLEFALGWGVNPIDRFDRYRRAKGRVDYLVGQIDLLSDVPNYRRDNDYKLELVRQAEEVLEDEHRLMAVVEVNF
jgi:hypothetical protein